MTFDTDIIIVHKEFNKEKFLWKLGFNLGNDYRISENGSKARNIYHLSIDINDGFEWEDFGNECIIPLYYDD